MCNARVWIMETNKTPVEEQLSVSYPSQDIFLSSQGGNQGHEVMKQGTQTFILDHVEYPETGGIFMYLQGLLKPRRGFPFPEAIWAVNGAKKITLILAFGLATKEMLLPGLAFMVLPWKKKLRIIEKVLSRYIEATNYIFAPYLLQDKYYMKPAMALRAWCTNFLMKLGMRPEVAAKIGLNLCVFIEYDNAYRQRLQDAMSYNVDYGNGKVPKADILSNPRKFIQSITNTIASREPQGFTEEGVIDKYHSFGKLLSFALYHPKIKRAFLEATAETDLEALYLDDIDYYHCLWYGDYDYFGRNLESRWAELMKLHGGTVPMAHVIPSQQN